MGHAGQALPDDNIPPPPPLHPAYQKWTDIKCDDAIKAYRNEFKFCATAMERVHIHKCRPCRKKLHILCGKQRLEPDVYMRYNDRIVAGCELCGEGSTCSCRDAEKVD